MRVLLAFLIGVMLAGCAGRGGMLPAAPSRTSDANGKVPASIVITIPAKTSASSGKLRPAYVSPATLSATVVVKQGATIVSNLTANLSPTSTGCTSTLASTQCTLSLSLPAGTYSVTVSTYDQLNAGGDLLSSGQNASFTIVEGQVNTIALTLSGIPTSYIVTTTSASVSGTSSTGFTLQGLTTSPQTFFVEAHDPDGNVIVGPGAPTFTLSVTSGSGWTVTSPSTAQPNTFTASSQASAGTATIQATAQYTDATCSQPGAVCSTSFTVHDHAQTLFVVNCGNSGCSTSSGDSVLIYAPPYTGTPTKVTSGLSGPSSVGLDASGNLWVTNGGNSTVTEYAKPYTGAPILSVSVEPLPDGVTFDAANDVFVSSEEGAVQIFAFPNTSPSAELISSGAPMAPVALSTAPYNMFVSESSGVSEFAASAYTDLIGQLNLPGASGCTHVGPDGELYAVLPVAGSALVAASPYGTFTGTDSNGPYDVTYDSAGHEYAADYDGAIRVWTRTGTQLQSILSGSNDGADFIGTNLYQCQYLEMDAANDLFAMYNGKEQVALYLPPYTGTPTTISSGMVNIQGLYLGP